jgi:hypothetical protein
MSKMDFDDVLLRLLQCVVILMAFAGCALVGVAIWLVTR